MCLNSSAVKTSRLCGGYEANGKPQMFKISALIRPLKLKTPKGEKKKINQGPTTTMSQSTCFAASPPPPPPPPERGGLTTLIPNPVRPVTNDAFGFQRTSSNTEQILAPLLSVYPPQASLQRSQKRKRRMLPDYFCNNRIHCTITKSPNLASDCFL